MQLDKPPTSFWVKNKCYRSRPVMYSPVVTGKYLLDIDGTNLLIFSLNNFELIKQLPVLNKQDQYCAKLKRITDNLVAVFGMISFHIVNISEGKIVQSYQLQSMIQALQINQNYITLVTSDLQEEQVKLLHCWKINQLGKITKKYQHSRLQFPSYEDCKQQNIRIRIIMSIDNHPRIYIFWVGTNQMLEIDPIKRHQEKYSRTNPIIQLRDIDKDRYAEVQGNIIHIVSKNGGKQMAQIINKGENFNKIFFNELSNTQIYTFSNLGLKMWKLEKNSTPVSFESSEKYKIQELFFDTNNKIYGINTQTNHILCWQKPQECVIHHFPPEQIKKIIKMNETQVCLLLEATASRQEQNEFHVEKYNKMQIYDLEKDCEIAKKAVLKFQYKIDIQSAIVSNNDTVRFILKEECENEQKKHIFRWSPFVQDKKKEVKKREIIGAKNFDWIKLFPFDRIVTMTLPKGQDSGDTYSVFGMKKANPVKTQICLFDFSAKKFGDYDLNGKISKIQMSAENNLYVVVEDKLSVYTIDSSSKNRLEKIHQLQVSVSSLWALNSFIVIQRDNVFTIYDNEFQLLMKQDISEFNQNEDQYKILPISKRQFLLSTNNKKMLFDLQREECKDLDFLPKSEPQLTEIMSGRVVVAGKGLKAYPYHSDFESV